MTDIRFFGGPLNERVLTVDEAPVILAAAPWRESYDLSNPTPITEQLPTVRYDIEKIGAEIDGEPMTWRVGVAQGFPKERITWQVNAVLALCGYPWSLRRDT